MLIRLPEVEIIDALPTYFKKGAMETDPVETIGVVLPDNPQITITQAFLDALWGNNCAVITCDSQHLPIGLLLTLMGKTAMDKNSYGRQLPRIDYDKTLFPD